MERTKRIMGELVRMPPKPHDEMKVRKSRRRLGKSLKTRKAAKKPG
jgi:hypothetical protein